MASLAGCVPARFCEPAKRARRVIISKREVGSARTRVRVAPGELALEFMMNVLRLREGCSFEDFEARTGIAVATIAGQLDTLRAQGLMSSEPGRIATTETGFRFLNVVLERFS